MLCYAQQNLSTVDSVKLFQRVKDAIKSNKPLSTIKVMVAINPKVLEMVDTEHSATLLAAACCSPVQHDIVAFLLHQCPRSLTILDSTESTPLHYACWSKASYETIQLLYKNYSNAVKIQNQYGNTSLLYATYKILPFDVIYYLAKKWPTATLLLNDQGNLPWDYRGDKKHGSNVIACLKKTTMDAACALIDVMFHLGSSMPWRIICHVAEVFPDIIPDVTKTNDAFAIMAVDKLEMGKIKVLLEEATLKSWLKDTKHQDLVNGFEKMRRVFLVEDPCNKVKDIAVMASVTGNTECLFLHLRSHQRNNMFAPRYNVADSLNASTNVIA